MEKKKSGFLNIFICVFSVLLALLVLIGILSGSIGKNSFPIWKKQFTAIEMPEEIVVLKTAAKRGLVNTENRDNIDYGIYWIIETDKTKQEIEAFFAPYIAKANTDVIGEKNSFAVTLMTDPVPLNMDDLEKFMKEFLPEEYEQNVFIVSVIKPGRKLFYN